MYEQYFDDVGIVRDTVPRSQKKDAILFRYSDEDFQISMQAFSSINKGINDGYTDVNTLQPFTTDSRGYLAHIEQSWEVDQHDVKIFADYNQYTFDFIIDNLLGPGASAVATKDKSSDDYRVRFGARYGYNISNNTAISIGLEQERRAHGNYNLFLKEEPNTPLVNLIPKGHTNETSAYTQLDYQVDKWRFLVGARYTHNQKSGSKVTPRLAALYEISQYQSLKLLYSSGFNSPNPSQTDLFLPGDVIGNPDVNAEVVEATDLAYSFSKDNLLLVANIYHFKAKDFIVRRFSPELNANSFFNEGNYTRTGAEIDFQWVSEKSRIFANLSYERNANELDVSDLDKFRIPHFTATAGAAVIVTQDHNIGASISHIGARQNLESYSVININYTATLHSFDLLLNLRNAFNEDILNPNITSQNSTLVAPGETGKKVELGVRYRF